MNYIIHISFFKRISKYFISIFSVHLSCVCFPLLVTLHIPLGRKFIRRGRKTVKSCAEGRAGHTCTPPLGNLTPSPPPPFPFPTPYRSRSCRIYISRLFVSSCHSCICKLHWLAMWPSLIVGVWPPPPRRPSHPLVLATTHNSCLVLFAYFSPFCRWSLPFPIVDCFCLLMFLHDKQKL